MNYRGAVFFDYDGTIADEREKLFGPSTKTLEAFAKLKENGYLVVLATGRSKCYSAPLVSGMEGYVTTNGTYVEVGGQVVQDITIPPEVVADFASFCIENNINYILEKQDACYSYDMQDPSFLMVMDMFQIPHEYFKPADQTDFSGVGKLMASYPDNHALDRLVARFEKDFVIAPEREILSTDVSLRGVTKANGVKKLIEHLNLDYQNTYAFGDGGNDYDMLKTVGTGVAMGIHAPCLEEVAAFTTGTVKEEGIYQGLLKLGLID